MIKTATVAICDICGYSEQALLDSNPDTENKYKLPPDWTYGKNRDFHICPNCNMKLSIKTRGRKPKE